MPIIPTLGRGSVRIMYLRPARATQGVSKQHEVHNETLSQREVGPVGNANSITLKICSSLQLQPGRMSPSQFARVPGFVGSPLAAMNPKLLQGRVGQILPPAPGFRAFFSAPPPATPPPQQHPPGPGPHLQNLRYTKHAS